MLRLLVVVALFLFAQAPARAEEDGGMLSVIVENDSFTGTDRNYTSGLKVSYLSRVRGEAGSTRWLARKLLGAADSDRVRFGIALGQSVFTPQDIRVTAPLPDQHPYAGWLYSDFSLLVDRGDSLDTLVLELGIIGPDAGGEWAQKNVHELFDSDEPRGWDNQLDNEVGVALTYDRKWRAIEGWSANGLSIDVTPNAGFSLGNVLTQFNLGLTLRIGSDLHNDYGPPRIRPSLAGSGLLELRDGWSWYLFGGMVGRAVAYNIFLDGNTDGDSLDVDRRPLVADFQGGMVLQLRRLQLGLTVVSRSEEFKTQDENQVFGALSISIQR